MSVTVLGISAFYHDAAAAIVKDGEIVAAAHEERFSRKKHDPRFPRHAINYCLEEAFVDASELSAVVYYENPVATFDRVVRSIIDVAPAGREQWQRAIPLQLAGKFRFAEAVKRALKRDVPILYSAHHLSHAASAFYPSPFARAAILTMDGVGEWATTSIGVGENNRVRLIKEIRYPHSIGLLYSAFTQFCGFKVNSGEYKLMGLAPYGQPIYADIIRRELVESRADGSFRLRLENFGYTSQLSMVNDRFCALFGGPARAAESRITRREMDLAASIQVVTEEMVLALARHAKALTGETKLVLAGGVALNCVANGRLLREGIFDDIWIQPASGDAGGALGAALSASHLYFDVPRVTRADGRDTMRGAYLGVGYSNDECEAFLERQHAPYHAEPDDARRADLIAQAIADGKVVGYLRGRMEFGPRSLGARSILGNATRADTQSRMNLSIKYRESFRPFAPSVPAEDVARYFALDVESPYMLLVAPVNAALARSVDADATGDDMLKIVNQVRSTIPAVTHVDGSARVQTVHPADNADYHRILTALGARTGCSVAVNTSFNVRGEPIVCSPDDAYRCFMRTEMDLLVLENCLVWKHEQPAFADKEDWRTTHELD